MAASAAVGVVSHVASAYFEKMHPPQTPTAATAPMGSWGFSETSDLSADYKRLIETARPDVVNEAVVDKITRDVLADVRGQPARR